MLSTMEVVRGRIKVNWSSLEDKVSRKPAQPEKRKMAGKIQDQANRQKDQTQNNEDPGHSTFGKLPFYLPETTPGFG